MNQFLPVILVRGFDPFAASANSTYYGFNDGTVYPHKQGDAYIYEGMLLNFLKTRLKRHPLPGAEERAGATPPAAESVYLDATNAIRYLPWETESAAWTPDARSISELTAILGHPPAAEEMDWLRGPVLLDTQVARRLQGVPNSIWVYRFYDFKVRSVPVYAEHLECLIAIVKAVTHAPKVNLICHSMGGIIARHVIYNLNDPAASPKHLVGRADDHINKWITLGTPHRGIIFQVAEQLPVWELAEFNQDRLAEEFGTSVDRLGEIESAFDPQRILCVVGTNHASYSVGFGIGKIASGLNQLASWIQGQDQNKSDGLVKQESARLAGAYRADVYKCHGGDDALVTSREAFELATRFLFGDVRVRVRAVSLSINEGRKAGYGSISKRVADAMEGQPELYVGFSVKPRDLDFYLHQQDERSENCFGPFDRYDLEASDFRFDPEDPEKDGIVFEGIINSALADRSSTGDLVNLVFRFDTYIGERDAFLLKHSDTLILSAQSYFKVEPVQGQPLKLTFMPRLTDGSAEIACPYLPDRRVYAVSVPAGAMAPDVTMNLEVAIDKRDTGGAWVPWNVT